MEEARKKGRKEDRWKGREEERKKEEKKSGFVLASLSTG